MALKTLTKLNITSPHSGTFTDAWKKQNSSEHITSLSPIDGQLLGKISTSTTNDYEEVILVATETFKRWQKFPAPKRGELIAEMGEELKKHKSELAQLLCMEMGKILPEAEGEIQEAIDVAVFSAGLSRQLYGLSMHSERPEHRMYEQWHPLGPIGVITAFNFPVAVWAWNSFIGAVCGNTVIWKPSELTPLTSIATIKICSAVAEKVGFPGLFTLLTGSGPELGKKLAEDKRIPLISATGSTRMGRSVAEVVGKRLGKSLLELGGNNAIIILKDADLDLAIRAVLFGAIGTAGQRCTTTRRILIEKEIQKEFTERLIEAYQQITIGNPLEAGVLMGPVINEKAVESFQEAITQAKKEGGELLYGGEVLKNMPSKLYLKPAIMLADRKMKIIKEETFAPLLYIIPVKDLEEAIEANNEVPQGLSSAIFTNNIKASEKFLSHAGSDCGIANVNIGTSGAEIGGAFGGEKDTGGGRESGSDSWKAYMRRQTTTVNWSDELPLAQGISFEIKK